MYTQSFTTDPTALKTVGAASAEEAALNAAFEAKIDADGRIEPQDFMPEAYRKT
ncbi:MAG: 1,2-phenylacetyl-CoA epoxidase, subunit, partial [Pseudomonadota bacterium]